MIVGLLCSVSFMPSVVYTECHKLALYAECHCAECRYAECHYAECRGAAKNRFEFKTICCRNEVFCFHAVFAIKLRVMGSSALLNILHCSL